MAGVIYFNDLWLVFGGTRKQIILEKVDVFRQDYEYGIDEYWWESCIIMKDSYSVVGQKKQTRIDLFDLPPLEINLGLPAILPESTISQYLLNVLEKAANTDIVVRGKSLHKCVLQARRPALLVESDENLDVAILTLDDQSFKSILKLIYGGNVDDLPFVSPNEEFKAALEALNVRNFYIFFDNC